MEDVKPAPVAVVVDLDSEDESEHVTPVTKNNNAKLSSESSLFSESSEQSDSNDVDMQEDHVSDHVSDEVLSEESDHVINDAPIEELSSDEDVSSKVSKHDLSEHVVEADEIDHDEQHFDENEAWIDNYVPRATSGQDTESHNVPDTEHISEVPISDMEDIPPVTSTFDFVEQFTGPAVTEEHVPENEHVNMSVDQGEEPSASQSRASKDRSSPHHSREEQSASVPPDDESAEETSVNQSVNQSLVSREDKSDSVNQSVNQSLASHDEHSDEEPRTRESLGGTIRRSSRLQQTPKPQYNIQKLSKRKASKKDEGAEAVVSETPAKLRRAAARVNDPLTKAKTKRMTKRK